MSPKENEKKIISILSRREFLKDAGLVVGGAALGSMAFLNACSKTTTVTSILPTTLTNTATVTATPTPTTTAPLTTAASNFPLTANTYYYYGGAVTQTYPAVPSTPKSVIAEGNQVVDFMVYMGLQDLIGGVMAAPVSSSTLPASYQSIIQSLPYIEGSTSGNSFLTSEEVLQAISQGATLLVTSNPSAIRSTIFTNDIAALNALGLQYYYAAFNAGQTTFVGSQYADLVYSSTAQYSWPEYFSTYQQLGILFNVENQVNAFIANQMVQINLLATRAKVTLPTGANTFNTATAVPSNVPSVMFMYWGGTIGTYYGSYDNGLMELMCETVGCNYLHGTWTTESILTANPQIIIISTGGNTPATPFNQIPAFASLKAVVNNTVFTDPKLPWTSNSGGLFVANYVAELGGFINPSWLTAPTTTA